MEISGNAHDIRVGISNELPWKVESKKGLILL
jgi:hypothetical protein